MTTNTYVDDDKMLYLAVGDNAGDSSNLEYCIKMINKDEELEEIKEKANGLYLIREMIRQLISGNVVLLLKQIDKDNKQILIPLGKVNI